MPKKNPLKGKFGMKVSGSKKYNKYKFWLEWEDRILYYKHVIWKKINLAETTSWDVIFGRQPSSKKTPQQQGELRSISLRVFSKSKPIDYEIAIPQKDFNTWLYWLLVSIQKHANIPILEEKLSSVGLKASRKAKIRARRDMKQFDSFHPIFIEAIERFVRDKEKLLPAGRTGGNFRGDSGAKYRVIKKLKKGGGGIVFLSDKEKISVSKKFPKYQAGQRVKRPTPEHEPVIIKSQSYTVLEGISEEAKNLIREARILSAIGEHPNIIRLIDVLAAQDGLYLFLEKGKEDIKDMGKRGNLNIRQMTEITFGMLYGLSHMHRRRIYHLDLKPENVLIFEDGTAGAIRYTAKLIDFGLSVSRTLDRTEGILEQLGRKVGTNGFFPKEALFTHYYDTVDSLREAVEKRDSYQAGMTILKGLIGPLHGLKKKPPRQQNIGLEEKENKYWKEEVARIIRTMKNKKLMDLAKIGLAMIEWDVANRLTATQALEYLKKDREIYAQWRKTQIKYSQDALQKFQKSKRL